MLSVKHSPLMVELLTLPGMTTGSSTHFLVCVNVMRIECALVKCGAVCNYHMIITRQDQGVWFWDACASISKCCVFVFKIMRN